MGIPIIALVDTNSDPDGIDMIIPEETDAIRLIRLVTKVIADACARGIESAKGFVPSSDAPVIKKSKKEEVAKEDASKSFDNKTLEETNIKDVDISADETETNNTQDELPREQRGRMSMEIKASQVKELRDMTYAAMTDCKKALDVKEILRKH